MRTKKTLEMKLKAFFIIFKGLLIAKNCLRRESVPLISKGNQLVCKVESQSEHFCFFCDVSFVNVLILATEMWRHAPDNAIYGVSVKLFSSVQMLIFDACTAFHPLFNALWRKGLGRKNFLRSYETRFQEVLWFIMPNMDLQQNWVTCFF